MFIAGGTFCQVYSEHCKVEALYENSVIFVIIVVVIIVSTERDFVTVTSLRCHDDKLTSSPESAPDISITVTTIQIAECFTRWTQKKRNSVVRLIMFCYNTVCRPLTLHGLGIVPTFTSCISF